MTAKLLSYSEEARQKIKRGVDILTRAVAVTLGPRGRNVVIDRKFGAPLVTKDGVTVAKEIDLKDPYENMGCQMVREVAEKTSDLAGDGTTTATVLAQAIVTEGLKNVTAGANPMALKPLKKSSNRSRSSPNPLRARKTSRPSARSAPIAMPESANFSRTLSKRSARTESSPSRKPRVSRPNSRSSRVCSSTADIRRRIL